MSSERATGLVLGTDQRQMVDWVAQGQYPIGLMLASSETNRAMEQKLPFALVPGDRFKEGSVLGPGGGGVSLIDRAPHPNAAKLYLNWLLSRDGQMAWQRAVRLNSLRVDIPKDGVQDSSVPQPGVKYVNGGTEEYARTTEVVIDLVKRVIG